jgi:hypothetical protein
MIVTASAIWFATTIVARAHSDLMGFIQHDLRCTVGLTNIDVAVDLTFHEVPSVSERQRMDANHNKRVAPEELEQYLAGLEPTFAEGIALTVDGRPVDVHLLHNPRLNLAEIEMVTPGHHGLRLVYFARTPLELKPGSLLTFEDRLWAETPAIRSLEVVGHGGVVVERGPTASAGSAAQREASPALAQIRCVAVPAPAAGHRQSDRSDWSGQSEAPHSRKPWLAAAGAGLGLILLLLGVLRWIPRASR